MPMTDDPIANLIRIHADTQRLRQGWRDLVDRARTWAPEEPVGMIMLDIDSSAAVRTSGIEAKVELVHRCRSRITGPLQPSVVVIDSGSRDETYLVAPGLGEEATYALAEEVRSAVAAKPIHLDSLRAEVAVTVSCGIGAGRAADVEAVSEAARAGLAIAKSTRNTSAVGTFTTVTWRVSLPTALIEACARGGIDVSAPPRPSVEDILMKYTGIRHWLFDRGLDTTADRYGETGPWRHDLESRMHPADPAYLRLIDALVAEDRLASADTGTAEAGTSSVRRIHDDRFGSDRSDCSVRLPASIAGELTAKVISRDELSTSDLIAAALAIEVDNHVIVTTPAGTGGTSS